MRGILLGTAVCLAAIPALAQSKPEPNAGDPHVKFVEYNDTLTVPITLQTGQVTSLTVSPEERIAHVVIVKGGVVDSLPTGGADQQALLNNVPLIGVSPGYGTLSVITVGIADQREHDYPFTVHVLPAPKDGQLDESVDLWLKFRYHAQEKQAAVQQAQMTWKEKAAQKQQAIVEARLNVEPLYCDQRQKADCMNYQFYVQTASSDIAPARVTDNGRMTAFQYPGNTSHPSIFFVRDGIQHPAVCDGKMPDKATLQAPEEALNTRVYDDMITVPKTGAHFRIRAGDEVAEVYGCAYDPVGASPNTGTGSSDVYRKVVTSAQ